MYNPLILCWYLDLKGNFGIFQPWPYFLMFCVSKTIGDNSFWNWSSTERDHGSLSGETGCNAIPRGNCAPSNYVIQSAYFCHQQVQTVIISVWWLGKGSYRKLKMTIWACQWQKQTLLMDVNCSCTIAPRDYTATCFTAAAEAVSHSTGPNSKIVISISLLDTRAWENRTQVKKYQSFSLWHYQITLQIPSIHWIMTKYLHN